jgi:hypothetical protein
MRTTSTLSMISLLAGMAMAAGCGSDGAKGADGADGSDGTDGVQGPAGPAGLAGSDGPAGGQGPAGAQGPAGESPVLNSDLACDDIDLEPPAPGEGVQIGISALFPPYYESEQCKFIRVPDGGWNFNGQEIQYTAGSHHVIVHRTSYTRLPTTLSDGTPFLVEEGQVFECGADKGGVNGMFGNDMAGFFAGSQNPEWAPERMPSDTAIPVEGGTYVIINAHFLNPTAEGLHTCTKLNLYTIPDSQMTRPADVFFWYNPFLTVPPSGESAMTATGHIPVDIEIMGGIQSHMHSRGASYVAKLYGPDGALIETLFETEDWETPSPRDYPRDQPLLVKAGSKITWTCNYTNAENRRVFQGLETTEEMCMFIGNYRPVNPADATPDLHRQLFFLGGNPGDGFFSLATIEPSGAVGCRDTVQCWLDSQCSADPTQDGCGATGRLSWSQQQCVTDSGAPNEALAYLRCLGANSAACAASCQTQTAMPLYQSQCVDSCGSTQAAAVTECSGNVAEYQALCTTATPMAAYQTACTATTAMATYQTACSETCESECGADAGSECDDCITGCVTGKVTECVTGRVTACVTEKVTACVTAQVTPCVTDCVVGKVTACVYECAQGIECKTEWDACGS